MDKRIIGGALVAVAIGGLGYWWATRDGGGERSAASDEAKGDRSAARTVGATGVGGDGAIDPARLVGTVTRAAGGAPVEGAVIYVVPSSGDAVARDPLTARTGTGGRFELAGIAPGSYLAAASAPGYRPSVGTRVELRAGQQETLELLLEAGGNPITGTVSDVSGGPIADAVVSFVPLHGALSAAPDEGFAAMTDAQGGFAVSAPDGLYRATAGHTDYVPSTQRVEIRGGERQVDFALTPGGAIEGVVLTTDGEPASRALVTYAEERVVSMPGMGSVSMGGRRGMTTADAQGRFRLGGLTSGAVRLSARGGGGATAESTLVGLAIGETVTGVELYLERARQIRGSVVDKASGEPAAGVTVFAMQGEGRPIEATKATGPDGAFVIEDVPPGSYRLRGDGDDYVTTGFGTPVSVGDADTDGVTLKVTRGYTVRGRVEPATRADVTLSLRDERAIGRAALGLAAARTKSAGTFELGPLMPGNHVLEATAADGRTGEAPVTIADSDVGDVVIELEPGAGVAGRVIDAEGEPVTDATVVMKAADSDRRVSMIVNGRDVTANQSPTHADGRFAIAGLRAGDYRLSVEHRDGRLAWARGARREQPKSVRLAEGEQKSGMVLEVETANGVIRGVARGPDGAPLADVWVTASVAMRFGPGAGAPRGGDGGGGSDGEPEARSEARFVVATSDEGGGLAGLGGQVPPVLSGPDGRFEIRGLKKGRYDLVGQGLSGGARGYLRGVETGADVELDLRSLAEIQGTVMNGGKPVPQFHVELSGQTHRAKSVRDDGGRFTLRLVDPGTHTLTVRGGGAEAEVEVEIEPGETETVEVELEALTRVTGRVVDEEGNPVVGAMVLTTPDRGDGMMTLSITSDAPPPTTGDDGRFELRVRPGPYRVVVVGEESPMPKAMKRVSVGKADVDVGDITVGEGGLDQVAPDEP